MNQPNTIVSKRLSSWRIRESLVEYSASSFRLGRDIMIIDSALTRSQAIRQNPSFPCSPKILNRMCVMAISYISFDGLIHRGQLVIHHALALEVRGIFAEILAAGFPIAKMIPISHYHFDDERSMQCNNTSGFNYRRIGGTDRLSLHAHGHAIDINPLLNPFVMGGREAPRGAQYCPEKSGTITPDSVVTQAFRQRGWGWGGEMWRDRVDYQHFEKQKP